MTFSSKDKPRWSKEDIRLARKANLPPLLIRRGYRLQPTGNDNYIIVPAPDDENVPTCPERSRRACPEPSRAVGLIVKLNYWTWPDREMAGNTIDFFVKVEGKTFHQAMEIIMAESSYDSAKQDLSRASHDLREEHGNVLENLR